MSGSNNSDSYRSIAKGTAMMGGVQVFNILINVIRGKLVAMLLGPSGMGISSLLSSTVAPIQQITSLGLPLSAVKDVAEVREKNSQEKYNHISLIRTLSLLTAIFGAVLIISLSPYLSKWTFGNTSYTWHFVALSVVVIFTTLANGEQSILQGSHNLKRLVCSSLVGSLTGLLVGVPLYYFFGKEGIVPAMIILSIVIYIFYRYHERKIFKSKFFLTFAQIREFYPIIKTLLTLGIISMTATLLGTICNYTINAFVRYEGGLEDVGYFQAANSITNQYVAIVFSAMSMDYFPRLAAVNDDNVKVLSIVNSQTEIVLLIITPIISLMILFAPFLIQILLTEEFLVLQSIIRVFAFAVFFKALAYPMGYISFAKGDKKTFFWLEGVFGNIVLTFTSIICYHFFSLMGLAFALVFTYIIAALTYFLVTKKRYGYTPDSTIIKLIFITGFLIMGCFLCSFIDNLKLSYLLMGLFTIIILTVSIIGLEKRLMIVDILKKRKRK